jgi:hypothetical protein
VAHPGALQLQHLGAGVVGAARIGVVHESAQGADGVQHGVGVLLGGGHGSARGF